jgi:hypothetical protein
VNADVRSTEGLAGSATPRMAFLQMDARSCGRLQSSDVLRPRPWPLRDDVRLHVSEPVGRITTNAPVTPVPVDQVRFVALVSLDGVTAGKFASRATDEVEQITFLTPVTDDGVREASTGSKRSRWQGRGVREPAVDAALSCGS